MSTILKYDVPQKNYNFRTRDRLIINFKAQKNSKMKTTEIST